MSKDAMQLGQGRYWQEVAPGDRFRTRNRTLTEADLVAFVGATGMLETIFVDTTFAGAMPGRPVPAILTHAIIEGMQLQTLLQHTALALLELTLTTRAPVQVGDTIHGEIEILQVRATSKGDRGVIASRNNVVNQAGATVLTYDAVRLVAGRPEA